MLPRRLWPSIGTSLVCLTIILYGNAASAQNTDERAARIEAEALSDAGIKLFKAGLYTQANEAFAKAYTTHPSPSIGLWHARSLRQTGRLVEALERLRDVTHLTVSASEPAAERKAQSTAGTELQAIMRELPMLTVQVKGARESDISLSIDGQPATGELLGQPQRVNPGAHHLEVVRLSDRMSTQSDVEMKAGQQNTVVLQLPGAQGTAAPMVAGPSTPVNPSVARSTATATPNSNSTVGSPAAPTQARAALGAVPATRNQQAATPPLPTFGLVPLTIEPDPRANAAASNGSSKRSTTSSVVGYGSLGTGVASLVVGIGAYLTALDKKNALNESANCNDHKCSSLEKSNVDSYNQFRTTAIIGLLGGAALVTTGLVTLLYPTDNKSERKVALGIGPASANLTGEF